MSQIANYTEPMQLTAAEIKSQVDLIQSVMKAVMKQDIHYGIIPGCKQPSLYKAGSEKILSTFRLAIEPIVTDLSTRDEARYRVEARAVHQLSGSYFGSGIGECSSCEEKYQWRKASCDEEFNATPEDRRRLKWSKGQSGAYSVKQVRTNIADVANTVLKMAKKRAQIDVTLTVTAASDIFAQDLEDMDEAHREAATETKPTVAPPQEKTNGNRTITEPQQKRLFAILKQSGKSADDLKAYLAEFGLEHSRDIPMSAYDSACEWAASQ